jgi:hypothetical protein
MILGIGSIQSGDLAAFDNCCTVVKTKALHIQTMAHLCGTTLRIHNRDIVPQQQLTLLPTNQVLIREAAQIEKPYQLLAAPKKAQLKLKTVEQGVCGASLYPAVKGHSISIFSFTQTPIPIGALTSFISKTSVCARTICANRGT